MTEDDAETMIAASLGELKLLEHAISHITEPSRGPVEQDLAAVAGQSSDLWAALGRLVILTAYTAIERLVVTFATDRDVSISSLLSWMLDPVTEEPTGTFKIPGLKSKIKHKRYHKGTLKELESTLSESLDRAGFKVDSSLAKRIVALKSLRNDCAHIRSARAEDHHYRACAGFSESVFVLNREDVILALRTLSEIINVFGRTWFPEYLLAENSGKNPKMRRRIDLMSDLPIYLHNDRPS
jgi:hypothetical protein